MIASQPVIYLSELCMLSYRWEIHLCLIPSIWQVTLSTLALHSGKPMSSFNYEISTDSPMIVHPHEITLNVDVFFHFQPICLSFGGVTYLQPHFDAGNNLALLSKYQAFNKLHFATKNVVTEGSSHPWLKFWFLEDKIGEVHPTGYLHCENLS